MLVLKPLVTLVLFELPQIVAIFSRSESQPNALSLHFSYQYFFALASQLAASLGTPSFHITHSIYRRRGSLGFSFWFSRGFPRIFYLTRAADQLNRAADQLLKGLYCVVLSFTDDVK